MKIIRSAVNENNQKCCQLGYATIYFRLRNLVTKQSVLCNIHFVPASQVNEVYFLLFLRDFLQAYFYFSRFYFDCDCVYANFSWNGLYILTMLAFDYGVYKWMDHLVSYINMACKMDGSLGKFYILIWCVQMHGSHMVCTNRCVTR